MYWIDVVPVFLATWATVVDLRRREIPDTVWILIVAGVPVRMWLIWPAFSPWQAFAGATVALLGGLLIARGERFGGGDVKLFAALGAWFGVAAVIPLGLWCAIAGLPLALIAAARGREDFAFGPAILAGVGVHALAPNLLWQIGGLPGPPI